MNDVACFWDDSYLRLTLILYFEMLLFEKFDFGTLHYQDKFKSDAVDSCNENVILCIRYTKTSEYEKNFR